MLLVIRLLSYSLSNFLTINAIAPNDKKNIKIRNEVIVLTYEFLM